MTETANSMYEAKDHQRSRELQFDGTSNFRDIGGILTPSGMTRFGRIYRSDRLSNLTANDGAQLQALNISTVIDMRTPEERERAPNRLPDRAAIRELSRPFLPRHTLPMFDAVNSGRTDHAGAYSMMLKQYNALALDHTDDYRQVIDDLIAPDSLPAIVHCTSGKDRTGMVAAILLLSLDTPLAAIQADYALTQGRIEKVDYFDDSADAAAIDVIMAADPNYITAAVTAMAKEFGSIENYLTDGIRLTATKRAALREILIGEKPGE